MKFEIAALLAAVVSANEAYPSYHYPRSYGVHSPTSKSSSTHHYHVSKPHNPYDLKSSVTHYDGYKHHDDDDDDHDVKVTTTTSSYPTSKYTTYTKPVVKKSDPLDAIKYKLHNMEHRIKDLESSAIILDYYDVNGNAAITIAANGSVELSDEFCVQKGQSVDIDVQVSLGNTSDVTLAV